MEAGSGAYLSLSVARLGKANLLASQVENARSFAGRTLVLARSRGERIYEAWVLRLLGDIASHRARPDVATAPTHNGAAMTASELYTASETYWIDLRCGWRPPDQANGLLPAFATLMAFANSGSLAEFDPNTSSVSGRLSASSPVR